MVVVVVVVVVVVGLMWMFSCGRHFETDVGEALWSKVNSGVGAALSQDYVATCSSTLENINKKISFAALCS